MNNRFSLTHLYICPFEIHEDRKYPNIIDYPIRFCVLDNEQQVAYDVDLEIKYDFIPTVSGNNFVDGSEKKIVGNKRFAIYPLDYLYLNQKMVKQAFKLIKKLEKGYKLIDGNEVMSNSEYLLLMQKEQQNLKNSNNFGKKRK